jgi:PAS domain S-box-containing protein
MDELGFIYLINNVALLIALAYAYSLISVYEKEQTPFGIKIILGLAVSAIGILIILLSWEPVPDIHFDARSILLAGSGLFLGNVPTLIAMTATGLFSWLQGGPDVAPGTTTVLASGLIGILWRGFRRGDLASISWRELYALGLTVHLAILALFLLLLPRQDAVAILRITGIPVLALLPIGTILFGRMMASRLQREEDALHLRESELRHRTLFENNQTVMLIIDPESGRIVNANSAAENFYGWSRDELLQKRIGDFTETMDGRMEERTRNGRPDRRIYSISRQRTASGLVCDVEIYSDTIMINDQPLIYALVHDVTDQKQLEAQLRQAQKMEAVGWLAGGIAHDYNNKLQAVMGFAEMALKQADGNVKLISYLTEINKAAQHSAQLTMQLMTFARKQPIHPSVLDMNETVERMLKMLRNLIGENIELEWVPGPNLWYVLIDPSQIDRVLVNLALNARDAIRDVGKITISTHNEVVGTDIATTNPDAAEGDYIRICIRDTGSGMTREEMEHIFEPFYTTKDVGKGTGLGLATVYGVIRQNRAAAHQPDPGRSSRQRTGNQSHRARFRNHPARGRRKAGPRTGSPNAGSRRLSGDRLQRSAGSRRPRCGLPWPHRHGAHRHRHARHERPRGL